MKSIILMVILAVLILPLPVAGGPSPLVERLMQDSTTTNLGKTSSGKKSSSRSNPALNDIGRDINGRLEAGQKLREHLETRGSVGEDSRVKSKRQVKAKRQRWRDRQKEHEKSEPQR